MTESKFQSDCIKLLKNARIYYINVHGGGWTGKGTPDLIVCLKGRFLAFELKVDDNTLQADQRVRKKRIELSGGKHFSPRTLNEFEKIIKEELKNEK